MEIHVGGADDYWCFEIVAKNKTVLAVSPHTYTSRRNAVAAAKLIAGSKLKVVVSE